MNFLKLSEKIEICQEILINILWQIHEKIFFEKFSKNYRQIFGNVSSQSFIKWLSSVAME